LPTCGKQTGRIEEIRILFNFCSPKLASDNEMKHH
jgi:hypothetical protein